MGVPAFFRWLSSRCPRIVIDALERLHLITNPPDLQHAREESIQNDEPLFDNLYLDMNGIIHPCCHPENGLIPQTETEMFNNIFSYIDKLMRIVRPRKLVYMAVDGVAPRAKLNQQRSRRFRSAIDMQIKTEKEEELKRIWEQRGEHLPKALREKSHCNSLIIKVDFDSNVITPGTPFMDHMAKAVRSYIYNRLNNDPLWKGLVVIFSDAQVPGEGEHKILEFIRSQRAQKDYDVNTVHCLYGADADLIMLGLSTHEVNFYLIREVFVLPSDKVCSICGEKGHTSNECQGKKKFTGNVSDAVQFQYISIWRVREFLELEFRNVETPFERDFERIVDDFIFLCFFVGNDFLPSLPSMYIRNGALDSILIIYKKLLPSLGGYLTNEGRVDYKKVDVIFEKIGLLEEALFREKMIMEEREKYKNEKRKEAEFLSLEREKYLENRESVLTKELEKIKQVYTDRISREDYSRNKQLLRDEYDQKNQLLSTQLKSVQDQREHQKQFQTNALRPDEQSEADIIKKFKDELNKILKENNENEVNKYQDVVRLGKEGYKARYYSEKFSISSADHSEFKQQIKRAYIEGLSWIFAYYYGGCISWGWYYPYHYAPLASDLLGSDELPELKFKLGHPFKPFEQLMSVLPPNSAHALPKPLAKLIQDRKSEIADFYPTYFRLDINGQRFAWMGVNLLPFIEEDRLLTALAKCDVIYSIIL